MSSKIIDFLSWSKKERIGVVALTVILLSLFALNFYFDRIFVTEQKGWTADSLAYYRMILDSLEKDINKKKPFKNFQNQPSKPFVKNQAIKYNLFDPNEINKKDWIALGFSDKQAQSILNYKNSIGGFKTAEDLGRCFVIDSVSMELLKPYIEIDTISFVAPSNKVSESELKPKEKNDNNEIRILVNLNKADSVELLNIKGIGPYFSHKIIEYRTQLGGYINKEQLLEIWNFDSLRYKQIYDQITIDTSLVLKLNINAISSDSLKSHPYIHWSLANAIIKYRTQHGDYQTISDLKNILILNDSTFKLICPYLIVE